MDFETSAARVAVVGAGPAGFYATEQLLKAGFGVDLYDRLPTPFGLVRAGVAPDHPKIKSVDRVFTKTARHPGFRFFGGVEFGTDVTREDLRARYHAVLYATGTAADNRLGIPGEDRPGVHGATEFVAWYNGHPDFADAAFDLRPTRAVVIGNGNVAIDVARMLVLEPDELATTDTADHAIVDLGAAGVREVVLVGRRGPAQAAFTTPEIRELGEMRGVDVVVDPRDLELDEASARWLETEADATARRNVDVLRGYAERGAPTQDRRIELRFLRSPVAITGDGDDGPVTGIRLARNRIEAGADGRLRAVPTGQEETLDCGLVLRSIGYRGEPLPGVPFDERRGVIRCEGGRVTGEDGAPIPGEYAAGWIKRGPSGVIGTNKKCAQETTSRLVEDAGAGRLPEPAEPDGETIEAWLRERVAGLVTWTGWQAIDRHETASGEPSGRPRVKLVRVPAMLEIAGGAGD